MAIALAVSGTAFAAFCVWLTVRIINRREPWAIWTLAAVVGLPVLYVASFGLWCWMICRLNNDTAEDYEPPFIFTPLTWVLIDSLEDMDETPIGKALYRYSLLGSDGTWGWCLCSNADSDAKWIVSLRKRPTTYITEF